jgi:hypothetical protein
MKELMGDFIKKKREFKGKYITEDFERVSDPTAKDDALA